MDAAYIAMFLVTAVGASNIAPTLQLDATANRESVKMRGVRNCDTYGLIVCTKKLGFTLRSFSLELEADIKGLLCLMAITAELLSEVSAT